MTKAEEILNKHLEIHKVRNGFKLLIYNLNKQRILKAMEEYKNSN